MIVKKKEIQGWLHILQSNSHKILYENRSKTGVNALFVHAPCGPERTTSTLITCGHGHVHTLSDICFSRRVPCPRSPFPAEAVTACRRWIQIKRAFARWGQTTDKVGRKWGDTRCLRYSLNLTGKRNANVFQLIWCSLVFHTVEQ